jgi:hypothetical protein
MATAANVKMIQEEITAKSVSSNVYVDFFKQSRIIGITNIIWCIVIVVLDVRNTNSKWKTSTYSDNFHIHGMDIAYYDLRYKENISGIIEFNLISTL